MEWIIINKISDKVYVRNESIFHIQSSGVKLIYNILHNMHNMHEKNMKTVLRQWGNLRQERS